MSYAIVFSSKTGNTELLADALHSYLPQADCCYFGAARTLPPWKRTPFMWASGRTREMPMKALRTFLKQLRGKQVFLFGTAGFGGSDEYFNKILKAVQKSCTAATR